jgi:glutamate dehydrogenase
VHCPAYLDYVGVKTFDARRGHRRTPLPRPVSSAAYTESVLHVPLLREKAKTSSSWSLDPAATPALGSSTPSRPIQRRAVPHPVDELAHGEPVMETRGRQLRIFVRRDTYGHVSVLVFASRPLQHQRPRTVLRDPQETSRRVVEFTVDDTTRRVHSCPPAKGGKIPTSTSPTSTASPRPRLLARRLHRSDDRGVGEDVGSRLARLRGSFPEAHKEDFSAATGALDLGRLEGSGMPAPTCRCSPAPRR